MSLPDYYRILGVSRTASPRELKTAYRQLARRYHPDLHPNNPRAEEILKLVNQAYDVLSDTQQRQHYDAQLSSYHPVTVTATRPPTYPASTTHPKRTGYSTGFAPRPATRPRHQTAAFSLRTVFLMWGLGLIVVAGFTTLVYQISNRSAQHPPQQIEVVRRTPAQTLLFADSSGKVFYEEEHAQKEALTAGEKKILRYRVQVNAGRVFIGVKGQRVAPGEGAPFADGEWIARTGTGTLEVEIPRTDQYGIFLNLDNFVGTITVDPTRE